MLQEVRGIILREVTVRKPDLALAQQIIAAQSTHSDRLVRVQWNESGDGKPGATATINSNRPKTPEEIGELSQGITGADKVSVQQVLRF
ncbi:MAG: hypothetical protein Q8P26_05725 [Candidatus Levybacteria bacterium]|nr:hypothetical protein [Candidatus Levybacteria bacterium]MDZ4227774.1 hypothetical protein [Candidatus Levybacteria bacterium]